jgi:hypothetical protein
MADPAIDGLVLRRSFTAERRRKSVSFSPSNWEEPPSAGENKDTGGKKRQESWANRLYQ